MSEGESDDVLRASCTKIAFKLRERLLIRISVGCRIGAPVLQELRF